MLEKSSNAQPIENLISASNTEPLSDVISPPVPSNVSERDEPSKATKEECPETQVFPATSDANAADMRDALIAINTPLPEMDLVTPMLQPIDETIRMSMPPQFPPQELAVPVSHRVFSKKTDSVHNSPTRHKKNALSSPPALRVMTTVSPRKPASTMMPPKFPPEELRMMYTTPNQPAKAKGRANSAPPESAKADKPNARTRALKNRRCSTGRSGVDAFQACLQELCERLRAQRKTPSYMLLKKFVVEQWGQEIFDSRRDEVISVLFTVNSTLSPQPVQQTSNRASVKKRQSVRVTIVKVISRALSH